MKGDKGDGEGRRGGEEWADAEEKSYLALSGLIVVVGEGEGGGGGEGSLWR